MNKDNIKVRQSIKNYKLTQEDIKSLFNYNAGNLYWKINLKNNCIKIGDKAGTLYNNGYYNITINGKRYGLHRLIFLYHYNYLPKQIDHIDRNKLNNKIENLREVTSSQNSMNRKPNKNCSSKYKGVCWDKRANKWKAYITIDNKINHLGYFINEIDAAISYNVIAKKYFGEYIYLNEIKEK